MPEYLGSDYRLAPVGSNAIVQYARMFAQDKLRYPVKATMMSLLHDLDLVGNLMRQGDHMFEVYGEGGAMYSTGATVGLAALRSANPDVVTEDEDWNKNGFREVGIQRAHAARTVEEVALFGLDGVRQLNEPYVEGYERAYVQPGEGSRLIGFIGLGMLHAHDAMHFASQRQAA